MAIQRIKRVKVGEQVFEQLKKLILSGEWKQGDKLPSETELAEMFGVSKITVRQELQKLNAMGLVETRLGAGTFVKMVDVGDTMQELIPTAYLSSSIDQIMEFRRIIDSESARLAARRATEEEIRTLRGINEVMIQKHAQGDLEGFADKDSEFHFEIGKVTKNPLFVKTNAILQEVLRTSMAGLIKDRGFDRAMKYHTLVVEAIAAHDEEKAAALMLEHLG